MHIAYIHTHIYISATYGDGPEGGFAAVPHDVAHVEHAVYGENVVRVCLEVLYPV